MERRKKEKGKNCEMYKLNPKAIIPLKNLAYESITKLKMLVFYPGPLLLTELWFYQEFGTIYPLRNEETEFHITSSARPVLLCYFLGQIHSKVISCAFPHTGHQQGARRSWHLEDSLCLVPKRKKEHAQLDMTQVSPSTSHMFSASIPVSSMWEAATDTL